MDDLPVVLVGAVQTAQFKARSNRLQGGMNPPVGPALLEEVCDRRKIDQTQTAFIL